MRVFSVLWENWLPVLKVEQLDADRHLGGRHSSLGNILKSFRIFQSTCQAPILYIQLCNTFENFLIPRFYSWESFFKNLTRAFTLKIAWNPLNGRNIKATRCCKADDFFFPKCMCIILFKLTCTSRWASPELLSFTRLADCYCWNAL